MGVSISSRCGEKWVLPPIVPDIINCAPPPIPGSAITWKIQWEKIRGAGSRRGGGNGELIAWFA